MPYVILYWSVKLFYPTSSTLKAELGVQIYSIIGLKLSIKFRHILCCVGIYMECMYIFFVEDFSPIE